MILSGMTSHNLGSKNDDDSVPLYTVLQVCGIKYLPILDIIHGRRV